MSRIGCIHADHNVTLFEDKFTVVRMMRWSGASALGELRDADGWRNSDAALAETVVRPIEHRRTDVDRSLIR